MSKSFEGIYVQVFRDGEYKKIPYPDMTLRELNDVIKSHPAEWWHEMAMHLINWALLVDKIADEGTETENHGGRRK